MAKNNNIDDDLLVSGSKSSNEKPSKSEKKAKKLANKKAKAAEKIDALKAKKVALQETLENASDDKAKDKIKSDIKKIDDKIASVTGNSKKTGLSSGTVKTIKSVIAVVVVIALLAAYVCTGAVKHGFVSYLNIPQNYFTGLTVTNDDGDKIKITVGTYNYYYATAYNNLQSQQSQYEQYGMDLESMGLNVDFDKAFSKQYTKDDDGNKITWQQKIHDQVIDTILDTYTYYNEAVKANDGKVPEITEDQESELKDTVDQYTSSAEGYGYTLSGYLVKAMGKGVTSTLFKNEMKISYIAQNYQDTLTDEYSNKEYDESDYENYRDENKDDLKSVSIRIFDCASEDDAKAFKKALKSDASNFTALTKKYAKNLDNADFYETAYGEDAGYSTELHVTKKTLKSRGSALATADSDDKNSYPGLDWLFSTKREAGDIKQYSTTVVYVISPVELSNIKTVNVRHILIAPETDEDTDAIAAGEDAWNTAYEKAKSVLKEWKSGDKTEDSFAELAQSNSSDNADDGGLYENVYPGQMVDSFGTWCFETSRKAGDTAIVKSDYGYHIMYFIGNGDLKAWEYTAQQALASDDSSAYASDLEDSYDIKENWLGSRYFEVDTDIDS